MIAPASTIRSIALPNRPEIRPEQAPLVAAAVADIVAGGLLLAGAPSGADGLAAVGLHGIAVLLVWGFARTRASRRWLCTAAVLAVPVAGAAVVAAVLAARGRAWNRAPRRARRRRLLRTAGTDRLGRTLSLCDTLGGRDEEHRRAALAALSSREDPEAIALLRRTAGGTDPDLALAAALVLDEIGERAERRMEPVFRRVR